MFIDELTPVFKELAQHPVAFFGGFFSGFFRLNLSDDPVKTWLEQQTGSTLHTSPEREYNNGNTGNRSGPQSISID